MRPEKKLPIELFAQYSEMDLCALETNLSHQPEGELSVQLASQEDSERESATDLSTEPQS